MNWGNKLVIVFVAFVGLMATLVYKSLTTKFDLVTKDYYKEELRYQEKIDGAANASVAGDIQLLQDNTTVTIQLPPALDSLSEGEAWFYCKTNAEKDVRIPLQITGGKYLIDKSVLEKETYELKLEVTKAGKKYYYLKNITIL